MSNLKIYRASAGSGKTYTLALEYIRELLLKPFPNSHRHILAVTFTKDATGEMKERILAELYGLAFHSNDSEGFLHSLQKELEKGNKPMSENQIREKSKTILQDILHDYSRLHITTIDSFFQKVLRNLARELGKGSKFNLEMNSSKVLTDAVRSMIENANENPQLLDWLTTYIEERLDEGANWRVDREILNFSRCIFNEHFQEHEFALKKQLNDNPAIFEQIWEQQSGIQKECKKFFQQAYKDVENILIQHRLERSDFIRDGIPIKFFENLANGDIGKVEVKKTIESCQTDPEKWTTSKNKRKDEIVHLATISLIPLLNQTIDILRKFNTSKMITQNLHQLGLIWDITNEISIQNMENNRFMLADTALFLNKMIDDSDAPFIYEKIGAEIRHVMIDEFQDTSRLQWKNFKALLSNILADNHFSLITGDVKQSIYRWRNGDWSILNDIEKELNVHTDTLKYNYRSEREIVSFNNDFFSHAAALLNEKFHSTFQQTDTSPFEKAYDEESLVQQTLKQDHLGYVSVRFVPDKTEDTKYNDLILENLLDQIRELHRKGIKPSQICILTRTNDSIISIAEYFATQKDVNNELSYGNYLNIISNEAFRLSSSASVRIIIEALRVIADPENPIPKVQLQFFLRKWVDRSSGTSVGSGADITIPDHLSRLPLFELIDYLFRHFHLDRIEGQSNYMFTFYDALNRYLNDFPADINSFLKYWNDELQSESVPSGTGIEGIRAMTIHKSKGLQFHTVLLPFCDWDLYPQKNPIVWCNSKPGLYDLELLPVKYSKKMYDTVFIEEYKKETGQAWMDNLNLLYVAFTRAESNLLILAKNKKKLESVNDINTVSDLLQYTIPNLTGLFDSDNMFFETGVLYNRVTDEKEATDNILKQSPVPFDITFVSKGLNTDKSIFKQSNKSREFIGNVNSVPNEYLAHGNIMHALFSKIETLNDIDNAVEQIYSEGLISLGEKEKLAQSTRHAIREAGVEDWFSGRYEVYNECAIIVKEKDQIATKRPDRVLVNETETIIIDYKFGEQQPSHQKQMKQYATLMEQMNYNNVQAYLWYVEQNKIISLSDKLTI